MVEPVQRKDQTYSHQNSRAKFSKSGVVLDSLCPADSLPKCKQFRGPDGLTCICVSMPADWQSAGKKREKNTTKVSSDGDNILSLQRR